MKQLIIVGAGGCGREVLQWAKSVNRINPTWIIKGFLDDNSKALEHKQCSIKVIGTIEDYSIENNDVFICAIGSTEVREEVTMKLKKRGAEFTSIVHPTAIVADNAELGEGTILYPFAIVSDSVKLQEGCIVNMHSTIAHDSFVGAFTTISAFCDITGACIVGERVFLGTSAKIVPRTKVGNDAFLCAGSIVMNQVKEGDKVMGNPAKRFKL